MQKLKTHTESALIVKAVKKQYEALVLIGFPALLDTVAMAADEVANKLHAIEKVPVYADFSQDKRLGIITCVYPENENVLYQFDAWEMLGSITD